MSPTTNSFGAASTHTKPVLPGSFASLAGSPGAGGMPMSYHTRSVYAMAARPSVPAAPSQALNRVREANEAAEAEDEAKHQLKDAVDARLTTWRAGKENNIRALIASLDTVLWPELGWQKVGIHELVSPSQVKIRYTKAIAKLHPDKVRDFAYVLKLVLERC